MVGEKLPTFSWALYAMLKLFLLNSMTSIHANIHRSASLFLVAPQESHNRLYHNLFNYSFMNGQT